MRKLALSILTVATFVAAPVLAQDSTSGKVYAGVGYNYYETTDNANNGALVGRLGYQFTDNFAIEGEGGVGVQDDKILGVKISTRGTLGAYAVAIAPLSENFSLIGRVGYQHIWVEAKLGSVKVEADDGSFGIGVGAQYMFDDANSIRGDYTRYTEDDGADSFAISYIRKF